MNRAIRVLVANRPKVMREALLGTLADQPWIEVVGEVSNDADIPDHVLRTFPDLLVIAVDEPGKRPSLCDALLQKYPGLRIIAVAPYQDYSVCYWASLDIHSDDIEPSEAGFLGAVRSVAEGLSTVRSLVEDIGQRSQEFDIGHNEFPDAAKFDHPFALQPGDVSADRFKRQAQIIRNFGARKRQLELGIIVGNWYAAFLPCTPSNNE